MARENTAAEWVGKQYRSAVGAFARRLSVPVRVSFNQEADAWFRRCARAIWKRGGAVTAAHAEAYNAICSAGNQPPSMLYFELAAAVNTAPEFALPGFFPDLLRTERRGTADAFVELCSSLFSLFAAADGAVSAQEADYADQCVDVLRQAAGNPTSPRRKAPAEARPEAPGQTREEAPVSETAAFPPPEGKPEKPSEEEPRESVEDLLAELDALCGLEQVKRDVRSLINLIKVRKLREENGLTVTPMSLHLVFLGNPGTGKTTVARLLGRLYHAIGVLPKGQLVETDRSGLVAGYVGQTAIKTQEVIRQAMGGILFIDEAYALTNQTGGGDFGREAIEVLLKNMEDHRDDLIVIVAGYPDLMDDFIRSNPGLASRFNKYFTFEDYTAEELFSILESQCDRSSYVLSEEAREKARALLRERYENRDENFGNAREVRNLFERLVARQSDRVAQLEHPTREDLMLLTGADFAAAAEE